MSGPTPRPWVAFQRPAEQGTNYWRLTVTDRDSDVLRGYCGEAYAHFVCRAANAHVALVEALEGLRYKGEPTRFCDHAADPCNRCDAATAALKLAKEGT